MQKKGQPALQPLDGAEEVERDKDLATSTHENLLDKKVDGPSHTSSLPVIEMVSASSMSTAEESSPARAGPILSQLPPLSETDSQTPVLYRL